MVSLLALAACGSDDKSTTVAGTTFTSNENEGTATIANENGSVTVAEGAAAQATQLPNHAPRYPGATIVSALKSEKDGESQTTVVQESTDPIAAVGTFYTKAFTDNGMKITQNMTSPEVAMIVGEGEGKKTTLMASTEEGKTSVILTFGTK